MCMSSGFSVDWWALGVLMFEMMAGRSPFDIVGSSDNPDQNTEDYLFQGKHLHLKFKGLTKQKRLYRVVFVCIFLLLGISFMFKGIMWISFFSVETLKRRSVTMGFLPDVFTSLNAWISHFPFFFCCSLSFTVILEKQIRIPRSLSVKAASVLKGFLNKVRRLTRSKTQLLLAFTEVTTQPVSQTPSHVSLLHIYITSVFGLNAVFLLMSHLITLFYQNIFSAYHRFFHQLSD